MIFLPIVDRELRIAARRRGTYWTRLAVALGAIVVGGCIYIINSAMPMEKVGQFIFLGLSGLCMLYCLAAGRQSTADCLSEEKREGTLGLLFLTDLKGYDIIFGKLAATSLNGFYGLLAVFPVLAIPLLAGGVTSGEFWRMVLVLMNTFLLSLAIGIFVSSMSRELRKAMANNFLLLLLVLGGPPAFAGMMVYFQPSHVFIPELLIPSPGYSFFLAFDANYRRVPEHFWWSVGVMQGLIWLLVLLAGWIVPHSWQDKPQRPGKARWRDFWQAWSYGRAGKRSAYRQRLLNVNAFYWLSARAKLKPMHVWIFLGMMAGWWVGGWLMSGGYWLDAPTQIVMALIINSTFKIWITVEAGQRLAEDQKAGAMELLLSTPLTVHDILHGQLLALRRQFLAPVLTVIIAELIFMMMAWRPRFGIDWQVLLTWLGGIVMLVVDVVALSWVATRMSLTARNLNYAAGMTVTRVLVLPWIIYGGVMIVINLLVELADMPEPGWKFFLGLWFGLGIWADLIFGLRAQRQLLTNFRQLALQRFAPAKLRFSGWFNRSSPTAASVPKPV
ncbi:MAG: hypothetical protein JWQ71_3482 [Pedosphaera sp.]|nr:hypothetical protein [Pedosphaera sp.]